MSCVRQRLGWTSPTTRLDIEREAASASERRRATLEHALSHLVRIGAEAGVTVESALLERPGPEPYEGILDDAERWSADVLVMGCGSHRGIGRALLGSRQTEHVLEFATVPVMVLPTSTRRTSVRSNPSAHPQPDFTLLSFFVHRQAPARG